MPSDPNTPVPASREVVLTFAELRFALDRDPDLARAARERLGLGELGDDEGVRAAGFASLLARELLQADGDGAVRPSTALAAVVDSCTRATTEIHLAVGPVGGAPAVVTLLASPTARVAVRPGGPGCLRFGGLDATVTFAELVGRILDDAADGPAPTSAAIRAVGVGGTASYALRTDGARRWQGVRTTTDGGVVEIDAAGAEVGAELAGPVWR